MHNVGCKHYRKPVHTPARPRQAEEAEAGAETMDEDEVELEV